MDSFQFFSWLLKDIERNLLYTSLVYTRPRIAIVRYEESEKSRLWKSKETNVLSPEEILNKIKDKLDSLSCIHDKIEELLRIRYFTVYVEDKSDKRNIILTWLSRTITDLGKHAEYDSIKLIELQARQWRINNANLLRPYHYNIPINEYLRDNEIELLDTGDNKWKSDTLQGLLPNFYHRTHTLVGSILYAINSRLDKYSTDQKRALSYLLHVIQKCFSEGYLEMSRDRKWNHTLDELRNSRFHLYNAKIIHAACAMISLAHSDHIDLEFLCQIITVYSIIPANAAKLLSSPMTMYVGVVTFSSHQVASTGNASECSPTTIQNNVYVDKAQYDEWSNMFNSDPLNASKLLRLMNSNLKTSIEQFSLIFNCFSATFHVGHRIDNAQDAITDQVTATYTSDIDREMYDNYYYRLKNMLKEEIIQYVEDHVAKQYVDVTAESLSALANSSNGFSKEVTFIDRKIKTTKKILHLDNDLLAGDYNDLGKALSHGIPMGTRNVPARQTRGIFILPWQVAAIQHTIAESLYKRAKKGSYQGSFAEAYTAKTASLTYGVLAEDTSKATKIILYTDVSQWDASQHNTEPYRSAWINAIREARSEMKWLYSDEPIVLNMNVLDSMIKIQEYLLNSNLIVASPGSQRPLKIIRYHGVASGEKTTKIGNSFANVALIETVLDSVKQEIPDIEVTHLRVDGDDNVVSLTTSCQISKLQETVKRAYSKLNARVKALASYTGLEMAKRFIVCGKIFERGAIPIFTAERPYGTDVSIQSMCGSSIYSSAVNAYRGFGDSYFAFMQDVLVPPSSSVRITGRLRVLLSPVTLYATGPLSFEITPQGLGGRCRMYTQSEKLFTLFKLLTQTVSVSVTPEEIKMYSNTPQFKKRTSVMIKSMQMKLHTEAAALSRIMIDKEEQKTLGVPNVQSQKNRSQILKAINILGVPEQSGISPKGYYPEELYSLVIKHSTIKFIDYQQPIDIYRVNNKAVELLRAQLGVRISDSKPIAKPSNHLYDIVSSISPIKLSPSDLLKQSRKYDLSTYKGKRTYLLDLGLTGNTLKTYLASKLLFRDLLLSKYDELYSTPGFGATQLTTIPLNISSAEKVFSIRLNLPSHLYEIVMLLLLYEYVHYVFMSHKTFIATMHASSQEESARLTKLVLHMLDDIQLDQVSFSDDAW
uniref:RNA-directed RNA polymerase n=1 Tax=Rotavirus B (isolate RVB/Human/China/ADRV/1982) TaxID=10942 RepID=D6NFR2_ROTGA|nr:structural protein VP1 [Human rotavirus B]